MNLRDACDEAIECLEMWIETANGATPHPIGTVGTRMVINRIKRALLDCEDDSPPALVAQWRDNYRKALQALHDENNTLRATAAKLAAKEAPRTLLEKFFNLPKD